MKTIVIDPGHGGRGDLTTYGTTGNGLVEKTLNLELSRHLRDRLLKDYVCRVVMTRDGDYDVSFYDRANVARENNADFLISVHFNGFHDPQANGFESFIFNGSLQQGTINSQHTIHNEIFSLLNKHGMRDRGKKRANFAMLRLPPCSCILPEYGFLTNPSDAAVFKKAGMIEQVAGATAKGIAKALNLPEKQATPPADPDLFYRVVVGSYNDRSNADKRLAEAKQKGFDNAFIVAFRRQ